MVNTAWEQFGRDNGAGGPQSTGVGANYLAECKRASAAGSLTAEKAYVGIQDVLERRLQSFELEYPCDCPTAKHWFQMTAVPLKTPEGGTVIIHRDVTALKEAEMAARESESRFRHVADNAPVMIWMSGLDKLCTYFNRTWLVFTGQPSDLEMGNGWTRGVHSEDLERCMGTYTSAFERRQPFEMEYRLRRHDGEYRWLLDIGIPRFNLDGSFAGYIGSCVDVSDRKEAEEAMASVSGRLIEAQEEERSRIARELHDDVGQRLTVLSWSLHELQKELPSDAAYLSQRLAATLNKASEISNEVRVLSHELHSSLLDIVGLAAAMESFCQEFAEQHKVEIDFTHSDIPQDLPRDVSLCIFRILQEGLHNAAKYSGERRFAARLQPVSDGIELVIRDSGMGFDVQAAMKKQGLGLVSMRERVNLVKGTLSIASEPMKGTEIKVRVPVGASALAANSW
jgi:PAS domain S-box-containing protein